MVRTNGNSKLEETRLGQAHIWVMGTNRTKLPSKPSLWDPFLDSGSPTVAPQGVHLRHPLLTRREYKDEKHFFYCVCHLS
jgi:hypothetical protein